MHGPDTSGHLRQNGKMATSLYLDILISVLAALAKQERRRISERTKAGLETAKRKGKRIGAPPKLHLVEDIAHLANQNLSKQAIAKKLKVSRNTVYKYYPSTKTPS